MDGMGIYQMVLSFQRTMALQSTIPGAHSFNGRLDFQGKKNQETQPGRFMAVATSLYLKLPVKDCKIFQAGIYI